LLVYACSGSSETQVPLPDLGSLTTASLESGETPPGRLLILGVDDEIVTIRADGSDRVILAGPDDEVERTQPTWSPDGSRVAWTERRAGRDTLLVVTDSTGGSPVEWPIPLLAVYMAWSPDGENIAVIGNAEDGTLLLAVAGLDGEITLLDEGAPIYFEWSPDGSALLARVEGRFGYLALDGSGQTPFPASGEFRLGAHLGESVVVGTARDVGEALVITDREGRTQRELLRYAAPMAFTVDGPGEELAVMMRGSPESQRLSQVEASDLPIIEPDQLVVVDAGSGALDEVSDARNVAWFWSPDGRLLLYATVEFIEGVERLMWHTWDGAESTSYQSFSPTGTFGREYLAYFDQFARSITLWAPDGSAFAYAGGNSLEDVGIWVQPLGTGEPEMVSPGQVATWSPVP
jgi:Tol biopolymer transport system component